MCGFFYTNDQDGFDKVKNSSRLTAKIAIRGPDSTEFERNYDEHYHIMFSRLVLSGRPEYGVQPKVFCANERKLILLFNGEIFNFSNLAREYNIKLLSGFGDTEVLVRLLQTISIEEVLAQLKGMYAICIVDPTSEKYTYQEIILVNCLSITVSAIIKNCSGKCAEFGCSFHRQLSNKYAVCYLIFCKWLCGARKIHI